MVVMVMMAVSQEVDGCADVMFVYLSLLLPLQLKPLLPLLGLLHKVNVVLMLLRLEGLGRR